jgi:hypothetical protein
VAFYVRRTLASGVIRFAIAERKKTKSDGEPAGRLSTDARGEYVGSGEEGLYFTEERNVATADIGAPPPDEGRATLWDLLKPEGTSITSWLPLIGGAIGIILIILGAAVLARRQDPVGWVEVILGSILIIVPLVIAVKRLREIRETTRLNRAERERLEEERRHVVGAYADALDELMANPGPEAIDLVRREREANPIPHAIIAPLGRAAVAQFGFDALSRIDRLGTKGVSAAIDEAAEAAGLDADDARAAKTLVFQKAVWHLLASDRLTDEREQLIAELRRDFGVIDDEVAPELSAIEELRKLRGVDRKHLPVLECGAPLRFAEFCHQRTSGMTVRRTRGLLRDYSTVDVYVSQKRLLIDGKGGESIDFPEIFGLEVDADRSILEVTVRDKKTVFLRLPDPLRTAQIVDLAITLPPKPKGLI